MLCALIMAGGRGTRFWPLSTEKKPKQFLNLIGKETMIQMTVNRIKPIVPIERIFICTGKMYVDLVRQQLPDIPEKNIIVEPEGRNTTPCIALSAFIMRRYYNNFNMLVLPSDHLISNDDEFRNIIREADKFIDVNINSIVTIGMKPTRPEIGYGYIRFSNKSVESNSYNFVKVNEFVEKPNIEKAQEYLLDGQYLWNGGMFLWSIENILEQIKKYSYSTYKALQEIEKSEESKVQEIIDKKYCQTESISIDYSVLEKAKEIYVIPSNFGWDDVGSWEALDRYREKDIMGNILMGENKSIKGKNNLIISSSLNVIVDELSDIYVIESDGKILVGKKNNLSKINKLKEITINK